MFNLIVKVGVLLAVAGIIISSPLQPADVNKWENGVIPIEIKGPFSSTEMESIVNTIDFFNEQTCIKLIQRTNEDNYVTIQNTPTGCWTSVGRIGGEQFINLESPKCTESVALLQHKFMHVLGFDHDDSVEEDHFHHAEPLNKHDIEDISKLYGCE